MDFREAGSFLFSGKKDMVTSVLEIGSSPCFFTSTNIHQHTNSMNATNPYPNIWAMISTMAMLV